MEIPKISIIVPVFNVELYLARCLDSLIHQTLVDIEIILIDDGSTDNSTIICTKYKNNDNRIVYLRQINQGQSIARNNALKIAKAPYIMFVDSDDWIELETCKTVYDCIETQNADVVMFSYSREYETNSLKKQIFNGDKTFDTNECKVLHRRFAGIINEELSNPENSDNLAPVCTKLYKTSIINENHLFFCDIREIISYEDGLFNLNYFNFVKKAVYIDKALYKYWRINWNSTTKKYYEDLTIKFKKLFSTIDNYIKLNNFPIEYSIGLNNRIALNIITVSLKTVSNSNPLTFWNKIKYISNVLNDDVYYNAIKKLNTDIMPIHWKFYYWAAKNQFSIIVLLLAYIIKYKVNR
jgi:glycosyltransferase EpsH